MKKITVMLLAALMLFAFVACDNSVGEPVEPSVQINGEDVSWKAIAGEFWKDEGESQKNQLSVVDGWIKYNNGQAVFTNMEALDGSGEKVTLSDGQTITLSYDINAENLAEGEQFAICAHQVSEPPAYNEFVLTDEELQDGKVTMEVEYHKTGNVVISVENREAKTYTSNSSDVFNLCSYVKSAEGAATGYVLINNYKLTVE